MDIVNDPAIRHANGKQVARWNVDIYGSSPTNTDSDHSGASPPAPSASSAASSGYGSTMPLPLFAGAHPRGQYTTAPHQHQRHPNGE